RAALGAGIEMHDLRARVHASVGAAGAGGLHGRVSDRRQRLLDALLHADAAVLPLPAVVGGAVVLDPKGDAHRADYAGARAPPGRRSMPRPRGALRRAANRSASAPAGAA